MSSLCIARRLVLQGIGEPHEAWHTQRFLELHTFQLLALVTPYLGCTRDKLCCFNVLLMFSGYLLVNLDFFRFWPISLEIEFFYQK